MKKMALQEPIEASEMQVFLFPFFPPLSLFLPLFLFLFPHPASRRLHPRHGYIVKCVSSRFCLKVKRTFTQFVVTPCNRWARCSWGALCKVNLHSHVNGPVGEMATCADTQNAGDIWRVRVYSLCVRLDDSLGTDVLRWNLLPVCALQRSIFVLQLVTENLFLSSPSNPIFRRSEPPQWTSEPSDASTILGNEITMDCSATGNPKPAISWKKASGKYIHAAFVDVDAVTLYLLSFAALVLPLPLCDHWTWKCFFV